MEQGDSWALALLEAVGSWVSPENTYQGRQYRFLIHGEAFDWILLAERLCHGVNSDIFQGELETLLFEGRFPVPVTAATFKDLVGYNKHRAFLNYWYGIGWLLVLLVVNQVISGVVLASYYIISIDLAFSSLDYIMREVHYG